MNWNEILFWLLKSVLFFFILITACAYYTLAERKVAGFIQDRKGPNRAGFWGLLQPLADGIKFLTKEEVFPVQVNKIMYLIAPAISMTCAIMAWSVVPLGGQIPLPHWIEKQTGLTFLDLQIANPDTGILFLFAISSLAVYGIIIAGWASNNKYSLLGAVRSTAQMISYELPLGMSVVSIVILTGSLKLTDISASQVGLWNIFKLPGFIAFCLFVVAMFAETNRLPFDLAEAESELVVGFHTEYGAFKFALFFIAEYMNMITMSCVVTLLFFGGYQVPFGILEGNVLQPLFGLAFFLSKVLFFTFLFLWVRWTLPRFRYDQLMSLGWKKLIPWAILNIMIASIYIQF
ncbi:MULTISPECIES: NADH-quinone oxidoreductase subunit NuoH [Leptospira]|uniref:NADH-quinone oxidoreductase subunit H n=3 Tax=Leptospira kirschneri TaxID=29507 RepID=A0A1T1DJ99_9LEPT|nr:MULTISPECIES: NADH-quinone oxidoreductase subunit NuoH [Leptospira]EJO68711.1 NADH dehydrogenase [Leptospira kirschneri serovar Grippotyphosa str. RM52]EKO16985.1 NADH dehydrogenase [Leptospira kirschneri str. H1]EKO59622.1 NADH dehydrogenase [Leptospira kirschneri str. H2]EKP04384.1 NADH dehydrogenase [Leptospira kirschneri str. 2008720114]EKQ83723.1 NADH dehydrogenase [Leptospira kirschneri serovar Grippotyphosa str. Moskva]